MSSRGLGGCGEKELEGERKRTANAAEGGMNHARTKRNWLNYQLPDHQKKT
ncbi:MAG: hypothetical protein HXO13_00905 [Prevotella salivae]|nr:hypothetical protein [Segatella salivae]